VCRLFGMTAGMGEPVEATFWLLDAPDSLSAQSHRNPDGAGVGCFDAAGSPHIDKQPLAAFEDRAFIAAARRLRSRTFVAHVRHATTGALTHENTHPFMMDGRLFAHNGVIEDLELLERELGDDMRRVHGQTDSERYFALITREIARRGGDVDAGIRSAVGWVLANLGLRSINFVLITDGELWALRYPQTHSLFVLERASGGGGVGDGALEQTSSHGTRVRSEDAARRATVVVASERMDGERAWRELAVGELVHVDGSLAVTSARIV